MLLLAAVLLAAAARRIGAPYPAFLAIGGIVLAFVPGAPAFVLLHALELPDDDPVGREVAKARERPRHRGFVAEAEALYAAWSAHQAG